MTTRIRLALAAPILLSLAAVPAFGHATYIGYSGAPGSHGRCAASCHGGSGGSIEVSGFPAEYAPGDVYTVTVSHASGTSIHERPSMTRRKAPLCRR